ncbi:hypothetical protein HRbin36_00974 [bacterium HR36]|nr:hypothetical protein HRbin36_00974 [bacterium HR36]
MQRLAYLISCLLPSALVLVAAALAQPDTPLPAPRVLPPETRQTPGRCQSDKTCPNPESRTGQDETIPRLHQELERLRQERERLRQIRHQPILPPPPPAEPQQDFLQHHVQRLLMQMVLDVPTADPGNGHGSALSKPVSNAATMPPASAQSSGSSQGFAPAAAKPRPNPSPPEQNAHSGSPVAGQESSAEKGTASVSQSNSSQAPKKPLAPMELGQTLFGAGSYEAALAAFRLVEQNELSREDRLLLQYLQAVCLHKLGRTEEAIALFREIANSRSEVFAVECAQWQLSQLRWQQETQRRLEQIRAWRRNREQGR